MSFGVIRKEVYSSLKVFRGCLTRTSITHVVRCGSHVIVISGYGVMPSVLKTSLPEKQGSGKAFGITSAIMTILH